MLWSILLNTAIKASKIITAPQPVLVVITFSNISAELLFYSAQKPDWNLSKMLNKCG